jgi:hypothetical protein
LILVDPEAWESDILSLKVEPWLAAHQSRPWSRQRDTNQSTVCDICFMVFASRRTFSLVVRHCLSSTVEGQKTTF